MAGDTQDTGAPAFAQGQVAPFGKFDGGEAKTDLDRVTYDAWLRLCASKNVTSAVLLRDLIYLVIHSRTPAEIAADDRREMLAGLGRNGGLKDRLGARHE
jgi:hypothetical protein